ncbi:MAG: hypothetical protein WC375_04000 [Methanomassiliicoccales archaeon]|jgi:hypothetical protein
MKNDKAGSAEESSTTFSPVKNKKSKAVLGNLIKICSGKRHAWYESNFGPVRKPVKEKVVN